MNPGRKLFLVSKDPAGVPGFEQIGGLGHAPGQKLYDEHRQTPTDPAEQITGEIKALPDRLLVATLAALGCPVWAAWQMVKHPAGRFSAVATWCLVQDAAEGRHVTNGRTGETILASDLVDVIRHQYQEARKAELISDRPNWGIGGVGVLGD